MLMPDELREALSNDYRFYLDLAEKDQKGPTAKQLRMMANEENNGRIIDFHGRYHTNC